MHPNAQTLQRFYTAFAQLDHATMAACYAPHATFDDEAFSLKGRDEVAGMWRMLCTATKKPGAAEHWKLEAGGVSRWGESSVKDFDAYQDFLVKWKVIPAKVPVEELVTNELVDEMNRFDRGRIVADAKGYK